MVTQVNNGITSDEMWSQLCFGGQKLSDNVDRKKEICPSITRKTELSFAGDKEDQEVELHIEWESHVCLKL